MKKIAVSCLGSRERYSISLALQTSGCLSQLYTDIYVPHWISRYSTIPGLPSFARALLGRNHSELPYKVVTSQYVLGLMFRKKIRAARTLTERQNLLEQYGSQFAIGVGEHLRNIDGLIAFTGAAFESFQVCERRGIKKILDQVDPGLHEWELLAAEFKKYPDWEFGESHQRWSSSFEKRVKHELDSADEIIVNSKYSMESLRYWGVENNITVLPIPSSVERKKRSEVNVSEPLKVLFLGILCLRKGVHIALQAIDRLVQEGVEVELILAGECLIRNAKMTEYDGNTYLGPIPGAEIPSLLDTCDVLLFPSLSEGFGMVQVEAISRGLPVIATKNSAEVIEHNESGFIVEAGDVDSVVLCLEKYCNDRGLLEKHSTAAYQRSSDFTREKYQLTFERKLNDFFCEIIV